MEQLKHFSHDHPLILNEEDHAQEDVNCYGCNISLVKGVSVYSCSISNTSDDSHEGGCDNFFLHKTCAELPQELEYPMHPDHRLSLHSRPRHKMPSCICRVCDFDGWKWFTYQCLSCKFDLCLTCVLQDRIFHHQAHNHQLTLLPRQALFRCDACDAEAKDLSYFCTTCPFWIHRSCASAQPILNCLFHKDHPLVLAYSLPEPCRSFDQPCSICKKNVRPSFWLYNCAECRFFAHIKCATSEVEPWMLRSSNNENPYEVDELNYLVHFPMPDETSLSSLIHQFVKYLSLANVSSRPVDQISHWSHKDHPLVLCDELNQSNTEMKYDEMLCDETSLSSLIHQYVKYLSLADVSSRPADVSSRPEDQISHWSHKDHPLVLCDELNQSNTEMKYDEMLCDGCVRPLSLDAFYGCVQCNYFLHRCCAKLPDKLEHPSHPEHKLLRKKFRNPCVSFTCGFCLRYCNGIFFCCESCNFYIDIVCASLPRKIKHESHEHPLNQLKIPSCTASGDEYSGFGFGCKTCNFYLSKSRAIMPRTIRHRWDIHPLLLMYPPVKGHPHEFDCEMCSKDINPNYWFYHCRDCDLSFHMCCLGQYDDYSNIKFGTTIKVDYHQHRLTFVQYKGKWAVCSRCNRGINVCKPALECAPCKYLLCLCCSL